MLYAVEYRNMHTAVHGLFVYDDLDAACAVDDYLTENGDAISASDIDYEEFLRFKMQGEHMVDIDCSEIDYRNVDWDDTMNEYVYRDPFIEDPIVVVNTEHVVHDLYL